MAAPTQSLPPWMTRSSVIVTEPDGSVFRSLTTLELPLTYYGPSVSPQSSLLYYFHRLPLYFNCHRVSPRRLPSKRYLASTAASRWFRSSTSHLLCSTAVCHLFVSMPEEKTTHFPASRYVYPESSQNSHDGRLIWRPCTPCSLKARSILVDGALRWRAKPSLIMNPRCQPNRTTSSDMRATGEGVYARHLATDQALSYAFCVRVMCLTQMSTPTLKSCQCHV